jgi:hypothetical protein
VEAYVFAFVVINVYLGFSDLVQRLAVGSLDPFKIGRQDVIRLAGGNALGEFAAMVRVNLPLGFLVLSAADLDRDAVNGAVVGAPDCPENQGVLVFAGLLRDSRQLTILARARKQNRGEQKAQEGQSNRIGGYRAHKKGYLRR